MDVSIKNHIDWLIPLFVVPSLLIWIVINNYPMYYDLSTNGIESTGIIIDYEMLSSTRRGLKRISHLYTFVLDQEQIRRMGLSEPKYKIGNEISVFYSKQGEGCLVGASKSSPFELAKYALNHGRCFKIREDLEETYKRKLRP